MLRPPQPVLHESDIEAELTGIARLELRGLQFDYHIPKLVNMEEQQVDEEVVTGNVEVNLPANESKYRSELAESVDDALDEPIL